MIIRPRWYQDESIKAVFNYFETTRGNCAVGLPTGTGKSLVVAEFIRRLFEMFPDSRVVVATHVKELVKQDADALFDICPQAPVGICSAGLGLTDTEEPIIYGGIKTLLKAGKLIGFRNVLIIDEIHMLSEKEQSEYQQFIKILLELNPSLRIFGVSATLFRTKLGKLTNNALIHDVVYNMCDPENFMRLIAEGYLCQPIPKKTDAYVDTSNVHVVNGEFKQSEVASEADKITRIACEEAVSLARHRESWLVFAANVAHSEHVAETLSRMGISSTFVHSRISSAARDERILLHKQKKVQALVGNIIFTTGYDHAPLDCIIDLQPTMSVVKHIQKYGRGTRPYRPYDPINPTKHILGFENAKANCLILDFARNTERLGPINAPVIKEPGARKRKKPGDPPVKECPNCKVYNGVSARECFFCHCAFPAVTIKVEETASTNAIVTSAEPNIEVKEVMSVFYRAQFISATYKAMKVSYFCKKTQKPIREFIHFESADRNQRERAEYWWLTRIPTVACPTKVDDALMYEKQFKMPTHIEVWLNPPNGHPEPMRYAF